MEEGAEVMQSGINHMASPRALIDQPCVVHGQPKYLKDPLVYHRISVKRFYFANTERKRPRPPPLLVLSLSLLSSLCLCALAFLASILKPRKAKEVEGE